MFTILGGWSKIWKDCKLKWNKTVKVYVVGWSKIDQIYEILYFLGIMYAIQVCMYFVAEVIIFLHAMRTMKQMLSI